MSFCQVLLCILFKWQVQLFFFGIHLASWPYRYVLPFSETHWVIRVAVTSRCLHEIWPCLSMNHAPWYASLYVVPSRWFLRILGWPWGLFVSGRMWWKWCCLTSGARSKEAYTCHLGPLEHSFWGSQQPHKTVLRLPWCEESQAKLVERLLREKEMPDQPLVFHPSRWEAGHDGEKPSLSEPSDDFSSSHNLTTTEWRTPGTSQWSQVYLQSCKYIYIKYGIKPYFWSSCYAWID